MFTENKVEATMNGMRSPTTKDRQSLGGLPHIGQMPLKT